MATELNYATSDVEERDMTRALHRLFRAISESGATSDPLRLVCQSLVGGIPAIRFAFYAYGGEETGPVAARKDDLKICLPPPNVQRRFVSHLRACVETDKVAVVDPTTALSFLSKEQRKTWSCHRCCVVRVDAADGASAILAAFVRPNFVITDRHRAWMRLIGEAAEALLYRRSLLQHEVTLAREAAMLPLVVKPAGKDGRVVFKDAELEAWVTRGLANSRVKAIVGLRGTEKSAVLQAVRRRVLASGADESHVVSIDVEDARFRKFRTAQDVMAYLGAFPPSKKPYYLFLDEVGMISWHADLMRRLSETAGWDVWIATSSNLPVKAAKAGTLDVFRTWADPFLPRSRNALQRIWCQVFMRDVTCGFDHPDIRAKELLAEFYSDHLGESKSLRDIVSAFAEEGFAISRTTVSAHRQALVDACLIEVSEVYDVFAGEVVPSPGGRVFYTDLELRAWRYGSAEDHEEARVALNRFYLELRKKHGKVYTPRDGEADFVTIGANGKPCLWMLPSETLAKPLRLVDATSPSRQNKGGHLFADATRTSRPRGFASSSMV